MLNRSRFETLYETYSTDALRLAVALTGDAGRAPDVVQTAFLRTFGRLRDIRNPEAFYPYLRSTIVNLVKDEARKRATERASLRRLADRTSQEEEDFGDEVWARREMIAAMRILPTRQRTVLVLRYYEDLSEAATAAVMKLSVPAVKSLTSRAITTLRNEIEVSR